MKTLSSLVVFVGVTVLLAFNCFAAPKIDNSPAVKLAEASPIVMKSYKQLLSLAKQVKNRNVKSNLIDILENPVPTFMEAYNDKAAKDAVRKKLISEGYLKKNVSTEQLFPPLASLSKAPQPFYSAPGSGYISHHSYPGGLATHTLTGVLVGSDYIDVYKKVYGMSLDRNLVMSSYLFHDFAKTWVFQWLEDGSTLPEYKIADTGAHHIFAITELLYRKLPAEIVVTMACAHEDPWKQEEKIVGFIRAASLLANIDPVEYGVLKKQDGGSFVLPKPKRPEYWITHFADYDWVFTVPSAKEMISVLESIAGEKGVGSDGFNVFRNKVFSKYTMEKVYIVYVNQGREGIMKLLHKQ